MSSSKRGLTYLLNAVIAARDPYYYGKFVDKPPLEESHKVDFVFGSIHNKTAQ